MQEIQYSSFGTTSFIVLAAGDSQTEELLKDLTKRNRVPRVGITASQATISLRITAFAETESDCQKQIEETTKLIHERVGEFVFGENGVGLENVVADILSKHNQSLAMIDLGFGGSAGRLIHKADQTQNGAEAVAGITHGSKFIKIGSHASSSRTRSKHRSRHFRCLPFRRC